MVLPIWIARLKKAAPTPWGWSLIGLLAYTLVGAGVYRALESDWDFGTAFYFTFTIISTVGYGCLGPSSYGSRVFTMLFTTTSVPVVAAFLANVWKPLVEQPYLYTCKKLDKLSYFSAENDDPLRPVSAFHFYARGFGPVAVYAHMFLCPSLALLVFAVGQNDNAFANSLAGDRTTLNFVDALYFTSITSSTVGFGDICPATTSARVFTLFMASYGLGIITLFANTFMELVEQRTRVLEYARQLNLEATGPELIAKLDLNNDGKLDRFEFVVGMLQVLHLVKTSSDIKRLLADFDRLDVDKNGSLTHDEIALVLKERAQSVNKLRTARVVADGCINASSAVAPARGQCDTASAANRVILNS